MQRRLNILVFSIITTFVLTTSSSSWARKRDVGPSDNPSQSQGQRSQPEESPKIGERAPLVDFESCMSGELSIQLNYGNVTPRGDLIRAMKIFGDFPELTIRMGVSDEEAVIPVFAKPTETCTDNKCARRAGWNEIQYRLAAYRGVHITCSEDDKNKQDQPQQEQPKQEDPCDDPTGTRTPNPWCRGGATGGNRPQSDVEQP
jgi:hypothetical protein